MITDLNDIFLNVVASDVEDVFGDLLKVNPSLSRVFVDIASSYLGHGASGTDLGSIEQTWIEQGLRVVHSQLRGGEMEMTKRVRQQFCEGCGEKISTKLGFCAACSVRERLSDALDVLDAKLSG